MDHFVERIDINRTYLKYQDEYLAAIKYACDTSSFSGGKTADLFDKEFAEYCTTSYASGVNNGTSALHLAMLALGVGPGYEVIVPANTYIATAWGVSYTGATPVFADCTSDTWEIDPKSVESRITEKTKGIIGVHLYGQPFAVDEIQEIATRHNLFLVEDCAQAHGALYKGKRVGNLSEIGCFSFYPGKNLFCFGEGGSIVSNNIDYIKRINRLKNQGCDVLYHHKEVGYNMRMEGIQAAVLSVGLKYVDQWVAIRRYFGMQYENKITNPLITMQKHPLDTFCAYHLFEVTVPDREDFMQYLKKEGVGSGMHYPIPCHLQEAYEKLGYQEGDCPNAEYLAKHCVTLPLHPEITQEEVEHVIQVCNEYKKEDIK